MKYVIPFTIVFALIAGATEAQVPLVAKMLDAPQTAEIARFTLQALPGESSLLTLPQEIATSRIVASGCGSVEP